MGSLGQSVLLELASTPNFSPIVQKSVDCAGQAFGLSKGLCSKLELAADEIFNYLCGVLGENGRLRFKLTDQGYFLRAVFFFSAEKIDLWAFNLTARPGQAILRADGDFSEMGLLLASRLVTRLRVKNDAERFALVLEQEKEYPLEVAPKMERFAAREPFLFDENPKPEELIQACLAAARLYPKQRVFRSLYTPAKFIEMRSCGELACCLAKDAIGKVCGLLFWHASGPRGLSFHGPYVFVSEAAGELGRLMVARFLELAAKTQALGVFSGFCTPELPVEEFTLLGELSNLSRSGESDALPAYYRGLREDQGGISYACPQISEFLQGEYSRLKLKREITPSDPLNLNQGRSVFAAEIRGELSEALLTPMLPGTDVAENLENHLKILHRQGLRNIRLQIDLSQPWQGGLGCAIPAGFVPKLVLPGAAQGDVLVFEHNA